jgi:D-alanyl-D-alanine carboxypeptidase
MGPFVGLLCLAILAAPAPAVAATDATSDVRIESLAERVAARCDVVLAGLIERGIPGASAAIVLPDGAVVARAAGMADADKSIPLTPAARMLSGSVGKTYVTGVVQRLLAEERLDLTALAVSYLDQDESPCWAGLPNIHDATLRQLLTHTSGIPRYVFDPAFDEAIVAEPDHVWTNAERLSYLDGVEPLFPAGAAFAYSDTNYILMGMVIEAVTGRPFYELAQEWLIEPHGLMDTVPTDRRRVPGVVQGHVFRGGGLGVPDRTLDENGFVYNVQFEWCGGGWASTTADLARWASILYNGRLVGRPLTAVLTELALATQAELGREPVDSK